MDSFSRMKLVFELNTDRTLDRDLISAKNKKLLADIEGELTIYCDDRVFFREDYILLLELAIYLKKWITQIESGLLCDFSYETMDYDEGPILEFKKDHGDVWTVQSIWALEKTPAYIDLLQIVNAARDYIDSFQEEIRIKYALEIDDFMW